MIWFGIYVGGGAQLEMNDRTRRNGGARRGGSHETVIPGSVFATEFNGVVMRGAEWSGFEV